MKDPKYQLYLLGIALLFAGWACSEKELPDEKKEGATSQITIHFDQQISTGFIGNGVQWDPYQIHYGSKSIEISEKDWVRLYERLDHMQPQFIRVMVNSPENVINGTFIPDRDMQRLAPILDYCQSRNQTVLFGDWGTGLVNEHGINPKLLTHAAEYLDYLVNQKGYTCIKYYNLVNEPNGWWSANQGNKDVWDNAVNYFMQEMKRFNLLNKVALAGPGVSVWDDKETHWIKDYTRYDFAGLYDIHTYASVSMLADGTYETLLKAYKQKVPNGKKIILGEAGIKFFTPEDLPLQEKNIKRARQKKYASTQDSQMYVYDFDYGIYMADLLIQAVNAGYSGVTAWMLDDTMHAAEAPDKLKIWGFWNILGEEYFGVEEEKIRPWYYAWSLLTKSMPKGVQIHQTQATEKQAIRTTACSLEGNYTIVLLNVSDQTQPVKIQINGAHLPPMNKYTYSEKKDQSDKETITIDSKEGIETKLPPRSLVVYTHQF